MAASRVDHHIGIALGYRAAEQGVAFFGLAGVAVRVFDFAGDDLLLAGGAVAHAAAVIEVEVVALCEFEDAFFVAGPVQLDA